MFITGLALALCAVCGLSLHSFMSVHPIRFQSISCKREPKTWTLKGPLEKAKRFGEGSGGGGFDEEGKAVPI